MSPTHRRAHLAVLAALGLACGPAVVAPAEDDTSGGDDSTSIPPPPSSDVDVSTTPLDDGSDDGLDDAPPIPDMPQGDDETGGTMTIPDCPSFDPTRVYLHGTLQEGAAYAEAITDVLDPNNFCVGFFLTTDFGIRPSDGRVVFIEVDQDNKMREFEPDPVGINEYGYWDYPQDPYGNDLVVLESPCVGQTSLWGLKMSPQGGTFYSCAYHWFDPNGVALPDPKAIRMAAITAEGDAVMFDEATRDLYVVTPGELLGVPLVLPREVESVYTGRTYDGGLWLVVSSFDSLYRWTLADGVLVEDGIYSDNPDGEGESYWSGAIDAGGDFWHTVYFVTNALVDGIARRRLAPDESEMVYREDQQPTPAVKIHGSRLFTGP